MTRAGHAALNALRQRWPGAPIVVLCGAGNNGGDGYVVARIARAQGSGLTSLPSRIRPQLPGDALRAHEEFVASGGQRRALAAEVVRRAKSSSMRSSARDSPATSRRERQTVIRAINRGEPPGRRRRHSLRAAGGQRHVLGCAVRADLTVTFIGRKIGLLPRRRPRPRGQDRVRRPRGTAGRLRRRRSPRASLTSQSCRLRCPCARTAHKGRHGHVLVIGGGSRHAGRGAPRGEARCARARASSPWRRTRRAWARSPRGPN